MDVSLLRERGMRHTAEMRVLASNTAAAQAQRVGRGPLETPTGAHRPWPQGIRSVMPVSFGSSVWSMFGGLYAFFAC